MVRSSEAPIWRVHIFVCTNEREPELKRVSCGRQCNAMAHVDFLKNALKQRGLQLDVRAQRAGCMELCEQGPAVAVYPQGWFFRVADLSACETIAEVADGLVHGSYAHMSDLPHAAEKLRIRSDAVPHVRARSGQSEVTG